MEQTLNTLRLTVTYRVGIGNFKVPQSIYDKLNDAHENGDEIEAGTTENGEVLEWLADNIHERDCFDISYEIDTFE